MPTLVDLREYEHRTIALGEATARRLRAAADGHVEVLQADGAGLYEIVATQYVGTISLPEIQLLIRPKVGLANLFWLLEAGGSPVPTTGETFSYATDRDLLAAFATFFARVLDGTIARGLRRDYRQHNERLPVLRGRVDLAEQLRQPTIQTPLACQFDEYTADIIDNRLLKAAARRLVLLPGVPSLTRRRLLRQLTMFDEVADDGPDPDAVLRMHFHRLNRHYEPALRLARLVLRCSALVDQGGRSVASTFLLDMNKVFEEFVEHRLRRALDGRLDLEGQGRGLRLDAQRRVTIKPDLVFRYPRSEAPAYVGDIKYKLTANGLGRESDYYQLLAYTAALGLDEGVLVYFQHDGDVPADFVTVSNVGKVLRTFALDLAGDRSAIEREIEQLADWIVARAHDSSSKSALTGV